MTHIELMEVTQRLLHADTINLHGKLIGNRQGRACAGFGRKPDPNSLRAVKESVAAYKERPGNRPTRFNLFDGSAPVADLET